MKDLMLPYKEVELRKIDIYLLQGIYAKDPDKLELQTMIEVEDDKTSLNSFITSKQT